MWPLMQTRTSFKVGNGLKVSFLNDKWIGNAPLKKLYPDLHSLCQQQEATVAEMWAGPAWNLNLKRHLNDWEMRSIASFYSTMADFNNLVEERDILVWQKDSTGIFSVSSTYKDLNSSEVQEEDWPWKMI